MYTSGWPKNQNKCWYNTTSPPPTGSKKVVLKLRSKKSNVIAAARTGKAKTSKKEVISTDQTNKGKSFINIASLLKKKIVQIKLMAAAIDDAPTKWKLKITKSTETPECEWIDESGGYAVQPVPGPLSANTESIAKKRDGGSSQKLKLFNLGNAISGAPIKIGTKKLPKPPTAIGTTTKKSINTPCIVTITLYNWYWPKSIWCPGKASSIRIITDNKTDRHAVKLPKRRYRIPILLWLVVKNHFVQNDETRWR